MDIATLEAEEARLILPRFDEATAQQLGQILLGLAKGMPVVINIRNAHRTFFHAALPGSQATNEDWARRKGNTTMMMGRSSMLVGLKNAERKRTLAGDGLPVADYVDHGGAVPIRVDGCGMVAVVAVSGLPSEEDHRLAVHAIETLARLL